GVLDFDRQPPADLVRATADFARFDNPAAVLAADRAAVQDVGAELRTAGYENLAAWIVPDGGPPLLAIAVQYFFPRAIEQDAQLFQGLAIAQLDRLQAGQESAFAGLHDVLAEQGQRLDDLLGDIHAAAVETRDAVLDVREELAARGRQNEDLYK